ncbi:MAG: hypothetical protein ACFFBD_25460 [Candidatus Hodarchaeota archaeon]
MNKSKLAWIVLLSGVLLCLGLFMEIVISQEVSTETILAHPASFDNQEIVLFGFVNNSIENGFIFLAGTETSVPVIVFLSPELKSPSIGDKGHIKGIFNATEPFSLIATQMSLRSTLMEIITNFRSLIALPPLLWFFFSRWQFDFRSLTFKRRE